MSLCRKCLFAIQDRGLSDLRLNVERPGFAAADSDDEASTANV